MAVVTGNGINCTGIFVFSTNAGQSEVSDGTLGCFHYFLTDCRIKQTEVSGRFKNPARLTR